MLQPRIYIYLRYPLQGKLTILDIPDVSLHIYQLWTFYEVNA
jgi:hypothetical protein